MPSRTLRGEPEQPLGVLPTLFVYFYEKNRFFSFFSMMSFFPKKDILKGRKRSIVLRPGQDMLWLVFLLFVCGISHAVRGMESPFFKGLEKE